MNLWRDTQEISSVLVLCATALAVIVVDLFIRQDRHKVFLAYLSFLGLALALAHLIQKMNAQSGAMVLFNRALIMDPLAVFASVVILISAVLTVLVSSEYVRLAGLNRGEYYGLVLVSAAGMELLTMSNDLITFFLSLEVLSLAVYILTGMMRGEPRSNEAAVKYFVIGAFATGILLYGMTFLYGATGTVYLDAMGGAIKNSTFAVVGLGLFMIGLAFKVGAVPFHMWVPDAYEGAPTAVTGYMAVTVKAAGFAALLRVVLGGFQSQAAIWGEMLWVIAALTMIVGNLVAITQVSVKRMLAYSSIAHTGYALLGVAACAVGETAKVQSAAGAALFYIFAYSFMTFGAFAVLILARKQTGVFSADLERYDDFAGMAWRRPWCAVAMTIFMISLAGIPPTAGFFAKFAVFKASIDNGYIWLTLIGIVTTVISLYYYLKVVVLMFMKEPDTAEAAAPEGMSWNAVGLAVLFTAVVTVILGIIPTYHLERALQAVLK